MSLLAELKRRNVIRVGAAYLVSAWVLIEIADILFPALGFPRFALQLLITVLLLGLFPILILAWAYELTSKGMVRDRGAASEGAENANTGRRLDQVTIAMILVALSVVAVERFVVPKRIDVPAAPAPTASVPTTAPVQPAEPADPRSVAVLPFTNMSPDPDNAYFADGIAEELLNVLAGIDGLKVASRTSAFSFKGKNVPTREIARALEVANILEGSVRKQGTRVRITAQLIDARTDKHLWSETYDRDLTDIFAVQEEIAQAISTALGGALGFAGVAKPVRVEKPTENLAAYEIYLRGRQLFHQRGEGLVTARALLEDAVARDPKFANAWAVLSGVYFVSPNYVNVTVEEGDALAVRAAKRARTLDDSLGLPYAVLAASADRNGRPLEALELFDRAVERETNDSTARLWRGMHYLSVGDFAKAEPDLRRALEMDPFSPINNGWFGAIRGLRGDRAEGDAHLQRAYELGWFSASWLQGNFSLADGGRVRAKRKMDEYLGQMRNPEAGASIVIDRIGAAILDPRRRPELLAAVKANRAGLNGAGWAEWLVVLGMHDEAIELALDPSIQWDQTFNRFLWWPTARGTLERPAFLRLAARNGMLEYWNAKGFPEGCRIVEAPARHLDCTERWR